MREHGTLPSGTVTFLFTDIEGSTNLVRNLGIERWGEVLAEHAAILRRTVGAAGGQEVRTEGDSFFFVFTQPTAALVAVVEAQRALAAHTFAHEARVRVRMGLHTGEAAVGAPESGTDYVGFEVHRAARIAASGHGCQILVSDTTRALTRDALPAGTSLRDLGPHHYKDLPRAERVWQLVVEGLAADFPALRSLGSGLVNLPTPLTSFVGREAEIAEGLALLAAARVVTLTGPGGTGKTRLSLEIARRAAEAFPSGVWFVPLAALRDPELVASTIASVLGLSDPGTRSIEQHLVDQLRGKRVLLVLDNFEQILDAAPLVGRLLAELPDLKAMASSRAALRIYGEQEMSVPPLPLPLPAAADLTAEALSQFGAVRLFIERARAARPAFQVTNDNAPAVAEICVRLDGLPLAIELAAARIRLLAPEALLSRLSSRLAPLGGGVRDLPSRQQTLRGAIAWSHDLLDPDAQRLHARLAVFAGGGALHEIERAVDGLAGAPADLLDALAHLADQSMLRLDTGGSEPRAVMLETIREFAREKLVEFGEADALGARHARIFSDLAHQAAPHLTGPRQVEWVERLERENDNLRAALDWFCGRGEAESALRMAGVLWRFWQRHGHLTEGRERVERALAMPGAADAPAAARGAALAAAGGVTYWQGDMPAATRYYREALALARAAGDRGGIAEALYNLSFGLFLPGNFDAEPRLLLEEALALWSEIGDRMGRARALWAIADLDSFGYHEFERAMPVAREAERAFRSLDDSFGLAWAVYLVGSIATEQGDLAAGRAGLDEAMTLLSTVRDISGAAVVLQSYIRHAEVSGDRARALRLIGARAALVRASGSGLALAATIVPEAGKVENEAEQAHFSAGAEMTLDQIIDYALGRAS